MCCRLLSGIYYRRGSRNFSKGGLKRKTLKEKCLLIHVSTRVHIKTRKTCNSFSLLPFQEDCLLIFALFYYSLLFLKFERGGGATPYTPPPLDPPMYYLPTHNYWGSWQRILGVERDCILTKNSFL